MRAHATREATQLLLDWSRDDQTALDRLTPVVLQRHAEHVVPRFGPWAAGEIMATRLGKCKGRLWLCRCVSDSGPSVNFARPDRPNVSYDRLLFVNKGREFWVVDARTKQARKVYSMIWDVLGPPRVTRDARVAYFSRRVTEADIYLLTFEE